MTHRERVLAAVNHQPLDQFPTDIWAVPEVWKKLQTHFETKDNLEIYDHLGIDGIMGIGPQYIGPEPQKRRSIIMKTSGGLVTASRFTKPASTTNRPSSRWLKPKPLMISKLTDGLIPIGMITIRSKNRPPNTPTGLL